MNRGIGRERVDVPPLTWELPVAAAAGWLLLAAVVLPAGQGAAGLLFGGGWVWPAGGRALWQAITGLAVGHPGRGLTVAQVGRLPGSGAVYLLVVAGEVAVAATVGWLSLSWWRYLGPGAGQGMAARAEIAGVLGLANVRARRREIRPDLYRPKHGHQPDPPVDAGGGS